MIPILTPEEMGEVDRAAAEPVEVLIGRAGAAIARSAVAMLGGTYGRRVVVIAGKGNNGNDGRSAAERLARRGVRVEVVAPSADAVVPRCDLVIDAAYGTGFRGVYDWPELPVGVPVLSVDIPSGVDGRTGERAGPVPVAARTVTFAALKPGLLFEPGATLAGEVVVADIGLDVDGGCCGLVERSDVAAWMRPRPATTNKWRSAVWVVAGSPGMAGAATLVSRAALRAGAGYVRQSSPGVVAAAADPVEAVHTELPGSGWASAVLGELDRFGALVIGNGLGTTAAAQAEIREVVGSADGIPVVVDADGLTALAAAPVRLPSHVVLTPHDGEYARLAGKPPGPDRLGAASDLARQLGCIVLLKGGPTVLADPKGTTLVVAAGDSRLATAGTGDVLAGVIGALAARGVDPFHAAAAAAFLHGEAGALGWRDGLVAGDLPRLLPEAIERLARRPG
jgi:ADP-dependent NAD(P)H-hydrate dehydratase / NAD(P)H-hydrate epimerase